jgi:hypothetical protein
MRSSRDRRRASAEIYAPQAVTANERNFTCRFGAQRARRWCTILVQRKL